MPGPAPRTLLRDAAPHAFSEALRVVGRPDVELATLGSGSNLSVRWRCSTCGQEWDAKPAARSKGRGCPKCAWAVRARSRAQAPLGEGVADLFPLIAAEFQSNLDRPDMGPSDLRPVSQQRCVWRCGPCGSHWEATVANRTAGRGCPACGNRRKAEARRRPSEQTGTAAGAATFPLSEFLANLTDAGLTLADLRPNSLDRCRWRCSTCEFEWEASVANRISKTSGCPNCARLRGADQRSQAPRGKALHDLYPDVSAQFLENLARADRTPDQIWPGSNALCRWRCARGHEWVTTVASRVAGTGCSRCVARGQSRLEFEVGEMLRIATGLRVVLDTPIREAGRSWRVDLALPELDLLVDLDPARWHANTHRDQRKIEALASHLYIRIRPASLPSLRGHTCTVPDDNFEALVWAAALRPALREMGVEWRQPNDQEHGLALAAAAKRWRETTQGRPARSAFDAAPHLECRRRSKTEQFRR
jgi:rubrerythrin